MCQLVLIDGAHSVEGAAADLAHARALADPAFHRLLMDDTAPEWSETGDCYLLKLFRDFVFHNFSDDGMPLLEWGHVIETLNKLDAGLEEKIMLMSRDEMSMLVVSYKDLRRCIEKAFGELKQFVQMERQRVLAEAGGLQ